VTPRRTLLVFGLSAACGGLRDDQGQDVPPAVSRAPFVVRSVPILGAEEIYPAPIGNGTGEEFELTVSFSESLDQHVELRLEGGGASITPEIAWSGDGTELSALVRSAFAGLRPLADAAEYALDLSALRAIGGAPLQPDRGLRAGRLVFTTGTYDPLLNHSCGHTLFGPFSSVAAVEERHAAVDVGTTHIQYSVLLPSDGATFSGWLRARFVTGGPHRLYFDGDTPVVLERQREGKAARAVTLSPTPAACAGITHELTLDAAPDETIFLRLGPQEDQRRALILERLTP
jgi:hypothetical protein